MGTIPGSHYHKTCSNRLCGATQFYGYTSSGHSTEIHFNRDWESLPYFVSSRESVFSTKLLRQFDSEIIIGQMSFQQCAEAYEHKEWHSKLLLFPLNCITHTVIIFKLLSNCIVCTVLYGKITTSVVTIQLVTETSLLIYCGIVCYGSILCVNNPSE